MKWRWIIGDYVDHEIELSREERRRVEARIKKNSLLAWVTIIGLSTMSIVVLRILSNPLGEWLFVQLPTLGRSTSHLIVIAAICVGLTVFSIVILGYVYEGIARRALNACGYPVCLKCGYQLRGHTSNDKEVCPECGTVSTLKFTERGNESD